MLQSGMRALLGVKVFGPSLEAIEKAGLEIERFLKQVPLVDRDTVIADRVVGKPYLEIVPDREAIARYGLMVNNVQEVIETAIGGDTITTTVEGRERYPVRVRYARELRDSIESLATILVPTASGAQIPLAQLAEIRYVRGPESIKSEDTFLVGYVLFDMLPGNTSVNVVEMCDAFLKAKTASGELKLPESVSYRFAGDYENQVRAEKRLLLLIPVSLFVIFLVLYFQFRSVLTTLLVFAGVVVSWGGAFIMVGLYSQSWFMNFSVFGVNMRELFQVHPISMSAAVWVGFIALFGISDDDGVVMATYLDESFTKKRPTTRDEVRAATVAAGQRRIRPCLMTTATTILALLPVLTSTGRGSDIMVPMAIPSFGGMSFELVTMLIVPVLYCWLMELKLRARSNDPRLGEMPVPAVPVSPASRTSAGPGIVHRLLGVVRSAFRRKSE